MSLRTSKLLKYFAIVLFSFEMIAPALISTFDRDSDSQYASILFEENSGEEEERGSKDHKPTLYLNDFSFVQVFIELRTTQARQTSWVDPQQRSTSQPALFTLLHTYLI